VNGLGLRRRRNFELRLGLPLASYLGNWLPFRGNFGLRFGLRLDCYLGNGLRCRGEQQLGLRLAY
jgi:hypothetical protein